MKYLYVASVLIVGLLVVTILGPSGCCNIWPIHDRTYIKNTAIITSPSYTDEKSRCLLSPNEDITIITTNTKISEPCMWGDYIVWVDERNGNKDIYMYDVLNNTEKPVCTDESDQEDVYIWGDKIVWTDYRNDPDGKASFDGNDNGDIFMYDISNEKEIQITNNTSNQCLPAVYGDTIAWSDARGGGGLDIYMYDLSTGEEKIICNKTGKQQLEGIYRDYIVWTGSKKGEHSNIYLYDMKTRSLKQITNDESDQMMPRIYGSNIVWYENKPKMRVVLYNITTSTMEVIGSCKNYGYKGMPYIYGEKVIYGGMCSYDNKLNLYFYNLSEKKEYQIYTPHNIGIGEWFLHKDYIIYVTYTFTSSSFTYNYSLNLYRIGPMEPPKSSPQIVCSLTDDGTIKVSWSTLTDAGPWPIKSYSIYRSFDGDKPTMVANLSANTTNWTDTVPTLNMDKTHTYTYTVSAWNFYGESNMSEPVTVKVVSDKDKSDGGGGIIPSFGPIAALLAVALAMLVRWREV